MSMPAGLFPMLERCCAAENQGVLVAKVILAVGKTKVRGDCRRVEDILLEFAGISDPGSHSGFILTWNGDVSAPYLSRVARLSAPQHHYVISRSKPLYRDGQFHFGIFTGRRGQRLCGMRTTAGIQDPILETLEMLAW